MLRAERRTAGLVAAQWRISLALLACVASLALAYSQLFEGSAWWWATVAVAAVLLGVAQLFRSLGLATGWATGLAAATWVAVVTACFAPSTGILGAVPTPSTVSALADLVRSARDVAGEESAPVRADEAMIFLMVLGIGGLTLLIDVLTFALRAPAVTGIALFGLLALPSIIAGDDPGVWAFILLALAWLWLLRLDVARRDVTDGRRASPRTHLAVAAIAALAVVGGLVAPSLLPHQTTPQGPFSSTTGVGFDVGINPMIDLGRDLRRGNPTTALRYRSTGGPTYLKVINLNGFSGQTWRPGSSAPRTNRNLEYLGSPVGLGDDVPTDVVDTTISVAALRSPWLPLPYPTLSIDGLEGDWRTEESGHTASSPTARLRGQTYTARSIAITPTANQVRRLDQDAPEGFEAYLDLPRSTPRSIATIARQVTANTDNHYDEALALQDYFRNGDFTYSEDAPVEEGYDGSGLRVLEYFLQRKAGYCVHFSSAMAVMARTLGIPSRIAIGYLPGQVEGTTSSGDSVYEVRSDNLHAWPELYFEGVGWLAFEPTPGRGVATALEEPSTAGDTTAEPAPEASSAPQQVPDELLQDTTDDTDAASARRSDGGPSAWTLLLLVLLVGVGPAAARKLQSWRRWHRAATSSRPASACWEELEATAHDLGIDVHSSDTPRLLAARWSERLAGSVPLARLLEVVERERFGRSTDDVDAYRETCRADARACIAGLRASAAPGARWRSRVAPRSLLVRPRRPSAKVVSS